MIIPERSLERLQKITGSYQQAFDYALEFEKIHWSRNACTSYAGLLTACAANFDIVNVTLNSPKAEFTSIVFAGLASISLARALYDQARNIRLYGRNRLLYQEYQRVREE
jgi:hypothetical protein